METRNVIMLRGLPGSGKSTVAKEIMKAGGNYYRVNRDHLREMMYFSDWRGQREAMVIDAEKVLAALILKGVGANLIIDDCNLGQKHENMWRNFLKEYEGDFRANFSVRTVDTPLEECIQRDAARERTVGRSVIVGMAMRYGLYKPPQVILCDLDGTIANLEHRLHYVPKEEGAKKDWKSFFAEIPNDTLITKTTDMIDFRRMNNPAELFYISARPENYRAETESWLERVGAPKYTALFMRRAHDKREDSLIKKELLDMYFPDKSIINAVYDDRPRVIRMWQAEGLNVIDCGDGIEF